MTLKLPEGGGGGRRSNHKAGLGTRASIPCRPGLGQLRGRHQCLVDFLRRAGFGMGKGGAQGELPTEHDDTHIIKCIHFTSSAMMYKDIIIKFIMFTMRFNNKNA